MEALNVHTQGNEVHAVGRHTALQVHLLNIARVDPELVDLSCHDLRPFLGKAAKLPGLHHDPMARSRRGEVGRPLLADAEIGSARTGPEANFVATFQKSFAERTVHQGQGVNNFVFAVPLDDQFVGCGTIRGRVGRIRYSAFVGYSNRTMLLKESNLGALDVIDRFAQPKLFERLAHFHPGRRAVEVMPNHPTAGSERVVSLARIRKDVCPIMGAVDEDEIEGR